MKIFMVGLCFILLLVVSSASLATPTIFNAYSNKYPNGPSVCTTCHIDFTPTFNNYGNAVLNNLGLGINAALEAIEDTDHDSDGVDSATELQFGTLPGDASNTPSFFDIDVSKSDNADPVTIGDDVTYTITVTNNGPSSTGSISLTDTLPAGLETAGATPSQGSCNVISDVVSCNLGTLDDGDSLTVSYTATTDEATAGIVSNSVSVDADDAFVNLLFDSNTSNNTISETTTLQTPPADLEVSQGDSNDPVEINNGVNYTITITNNGANDATGVTMVDTLPAGGDGFSIAFASQGTCSGPTGGVLTCEIGDIDNGDSETVTVIIIPTVSMLGTVTNTVTVSGDQTDNNSANNTSSETTLVELPETDLAVNISENADPVPGNDNITYELTMSNNGPKDAGGVTLVTDLPADSNFISAALSTGICDDPSGSTLHCNIGFIDAAGSVTLTLIISPTTLGDLSITTTIAGDIIDSNIANNSVSESTTVRATVSDLGIEIAESADPVTGGGDITYQLTVFNDGPEDAGSVTLATVLPSGLNFISASPGKGSCDEPSGTILNCNIGSIDSGGNVIVTLIFTPAINGEISLTSSVDGNVDDPDLNNNSITETTIIEGVTVIADDDFMQLLLIIKILLEE